MIYVTLSYSLDSGIGPPFGLRQSVCGKISSAGANPVSATMTSSGPKKLTLVMGSSRPRPRASEPF